MEFAIRNLLSAWEQGAAEIMAMQPFAEEGFDICLPCREREGEAELPSANERNQGSDIKISRLVHRIELQNEYFGTENESSAPKEDKRDLLGQPRYTNNNSKHGRKSLNDLELASQEQTSRPNLVTLSKDKIPVPRFSKSMTNLYSSHDNRTALAGKQKATTTLSFRAKHLEIMANKASDELKMQRLAQARHDFRMGVAPKEVLTISGRGRNARPQHDYELAPKRTI